MFWHFFALLALYLPAFIANGAPVVASKAPGLRKWNVPIAAEWFGNNKTWRGYICGIFVAGITGAVEHFFRHTLLLVSFGLHTSLFQSIGTGLLLGFGALSGDILKSFVKRRMGIPPGNALPVLDGIDYIIGALVVFLPFYVPTWWEILFLLIAAPVLSLLSNTTAHILGWKKVWY